MPTPANDRCVDDDFVPSPRRAVASVPVEHELLLVDEERDGLHVLDGTAGVAWHCFDGVGTVRDIAIDIAEGFDAPYEVVQADLARLVWTMAREGLVVGGDADQGDEPGDPIEQDDRFVHEPGGG